MPARKLIGETRKGVSKIRHERRRRRKKVGKEKEEGKNLCGRTWWYS